jgi:hypothetical protein
VARFRVSPPRCSDQDQAHCVKTWRSVTASDLTRRLQEALTLPPFSKPATPDRKKPAPAPSARWAHNSVSV